MRKILSLFFVVILSTCGLFMLSLTAHADDSAVITSEVETTPTASGTCGENVIWAYYEETGLLEINGSGDMQGYASIQVPWYAYKNKIKKLSITKDVTSIGDLAFYDCNGMTSLTISNSVTTIEFGSFMYCSGLTSVTIPNSVTIIEEDAFGYCSGLTSVTIGDSVEEIGDEVFKNCTGLTSVTIPNSVKIIGERAFKDCTGLTSVTIGNSVRSIEDGAFYGCSKLLEVYCYAETMPSAFRNAFDSTPMANATLHVPAASIHVYKANTPWSGFGNIVALPNEFSLTVSSAGYAVLYLDFNAEIPEGVQAYTGVKVVGNSLKMKRVEGVLPANTGVVIRAEEGTYTFADSDATPAAIGDNLLYGTVTATQISTDPDYYYFVLSKVDGIVGMYLTELTDGKFLNNANTAYLAIAKKALGFSVMDIILLICFIPAIIQGLRKGFIAQAVSIISIIAGLWAASQFTETVAEWGSQYLAVSEQAMNIIAFALIMIVVFLALGLVGKLLEGLFKMVLLGWVNRLLGLAFALLKTALIVGLLVIIFSSVNESLQLVEESVLNESMLYPPFKKFAFDVFPQIKELLAFTK